MQAGKQNGFVMLRTLAFALVIIVGVFTLFRVIPIYYNDYVLMNVLKDTAKQVDRGVWMNGPAGKEQIQKILYKQFSVNYINNIDVEQVQIVSTGAKPELKIEYDVHVPLIANLSLTAHFDHSVEAN